MNKVLLAARNLTSARKQHHCTVEFWAGEVAEVHLLSYPTDAVLTLAQAVSGYTGNYEPTIEENRLSSLLSDLKKTKLGTPAEMLNFVWLIRDVPRSWTHQAVRTRIGASVVQESTRFIGQKNVYKILVPGSMQEPGVLRVKEEYEESIVISIEAYENLVEQEGVESQDARNILPHALLTNMYWSLTLRALMGIYEVRWCCQAEPSTWIPVMKQMKKWISRSCGQYIADFLTAPIDRNQNCGFNASFDRSCVWRERNETK